ncbi:hypothetical protein [Nocardioides sp. B-3]|uniref:hypothetical protein n=1 Tax=Nocardioides sp. B-3 TaxID=2895565 RepID=UPI00215315E0|nr:hypothetical protein [Nocardioides sp. B-3]UUZ61023.1 hypothetical protein LP418_10315 [Nocardioides sp. B-3]
MLARLHALNLAGAGRDRSDSDGRVDDGGEGGVDDLAIAEEAALRAARDPALLLGDGGS